MSSPGGGSLFAVYALADRLGKTVGEIMKMPESEFGGWVGYLEALKEKQNAG